MNSQTQIIALHGLALALAASTAACGRRDYDIGSRGDSDIAQADANERIDAPVYDARPSLPDANYPDVAPLAEDAPATFCASHESDPACLAFDASNCASLNASITVVVDGALARYAPSRHEVVYDVPNLPGVSYGTLTSPIDLAMRSDTGVLIVQDFVMSGRIYSLRDGMITTAFNRDVVDAEFWSGAFVGPLHDQLIILRRADPAMTSNRWAIYQPSGTSVVLRGQIDFSTGNAAPPQVAATPQGRAFLLVPSVGLVEFDGSGAVLAQTPIDGLPAFNRRNDFTFHEGFFYVFFPEVTDVRSTAIWRFGLPASGRSLAMLYDTVRGYIELADAPHCYP